MPADPVKERLRFLPESKDTRAGYRGGILPDTEQNMQQGAPDARQGVLSGLDQGRKLGEAGILVQEPVDPVCKILVDIDIFRELFPFIQELFVQEKIKVARDNEAPVLKLAFQECERRGGELGTQPFRKRHAMLQQGRADPCC